jgi:hypothetical protein
MTKKIQNYKTELYKRNAQKSLKNSKNIFQDFETAKKGKIKQRSKNFTTKRLKSNEQLVGLEITLIGRIKGAAKARKTTTGLSGTLKPQTILGSEYYSISQKQVFTK